jgi:hypothetical protein
MEEKIRIRIDIKRGGVILLRAVETMRRRKIRERNLSSGGERGPIKWVTSKIERKNKKESLMNMIFLIISLLSPL